MNWNIKIWIVLCLKPLLNEVYYGKEDVLFFFFFHLGYDKRD